MCTSCYFHWWKLTGNCPRCPFCIFPIFLKLHICIFTIFLNLYIYHIFNWILQIAVLANPIFRRYFCRMSQKRLQHRTRFLLTTIWLCCSIKKVEVIKAPVNIVTFSRLEVAWRISSGDTLMVASGQKVTSVIWLSGVISFDNKVSSSLLSFLCFQLKINIWQCFLVFESPDRV